MPKHEGNAHGRHYSEDEREDDAQRNFNRAKGRNHFEVDEDQKAGGHSDRHASAASDSGGQQHVFASDKNDDDVNRHDQAQSTGHMQGSAHKSGGHQNGRHQNNS
ncbi:MAG TPA: hypothetical protein VH186_11910 [Chloroflexia bacterium]|nr:hypothetical protein [Chloroflexia bacterium]